MIDRKDLRIGNWILNDRVPNLIENLLSDGRLTLFTKQGNFIHASYELIQPVPLTTEVLEKAGFEMNPDWNDKRKDGSKAFKDLGYLALSSSVMGDSVTLFDNNALSTGVHVDYLHQLQNLYYILTGTELIIKL